MTMTTAGEREALLHRRNALSSLLADKPACERLPDRGRRLEERLAAIDAELAALETRPPSPPVPLAPAPAVQTAGIVERTPAVPPQPPRELRHMPPAPRPLPASDVAAAETQVLSSANTVAREASSAAVHVLSSASPTDDSSTGRTSEVAARTSNVAAVSPTVSSATPATQPVQVSPASASMAGATSESTAAPLPTDDRLRLTSEAILAMSTDELEAALATQLVVDGVGSEDAVRQLLAAPSLESFARNMHTRRGERVPTVKALSAADTLRLQAQRAQRAAESKRRRRAAPAVTVGQSTVPRVNRSPYPNPNCEPSRNEAATSSAPTFAGRSTVAATSASTVDHMPKTQAEGDK